MFTGAWFGVALWADDAGHRRDSFQFLAAGSVLDRRFRRLEGDSGSLQDFRSEAYFGLIRNLQRVRLADAVSVWRFAGGV
jgi:hypothetical protein